MWMINAIIGCVRRKRDWLGGQNVVSNTDDKNEGETLQSRPL
jgi:hypothetical protein